MKPFTTILFLLVFISAYSQKESRLNRFDAFLLYNTESHEGSIILNGGSELKGLIAYNDKSGSLKFENGNDSRSLTAKSVLGFEMFDPNFDGYRLFYSLPKEDPNTGTIRQYFFELVQDFQSFAVLIRKEPVTIKERQPHLDQTLSVYDPLYSNRKVLTIQQEETFYLMKPQEDPKPYFSIITSNTDRKPILFDNQRVREKFISRDLFEEYTGSLFEKIKEYAKENKLSFKEKADFLKILEYYESLLNSE